MRRTIALALASVVILCAGSTAAFAADAPLVDINNGDKATIVYIPMSTGQEDFKKLEPKNIKSIEVMKDSPAAKYLQELKDQGKYQGDINPKGGVIVVNLKK